MGKGDLWDDSALIKAFDSAISKYKVMHGTGGSNSGSKVNGGSENVQSGDKICADNPVEIVESAEVEQISEKINSELSFSTENVSSSDIQGAVSPTIGSTAVESDPLGKQFASSDANQNQFAWYSNGSEECNLLWNRYYVIEEERQKITEQLNKYGNWNYQYSASQEHQESVPQSYDTITCYCPYGCQNWSVPCDSSTAHCVDGNCTDKNCTVNSKSVHHGSPLCEESRDIVKTAMAAAEKALSSLTKGEGKDKDFQMETGDLLESTHSATDLSVVLKAWYSAGFYTGKYLSEQSSEKRKNS